MIENISQGARLAYIRKFRNLTQNEVADEFNFTGEEKRRSICNYENNKRKMRDDKLKKLADLYNVSINAIKEYTFDNPLDYIYQAMWLELQFPGIKFEAKVINFPGTTDNMIIIMLIDRWMKMIEKRENKIITFNEYLEWMFNYKIGD